MELYHDNKLNLQLRNFHVGQKGLLARKKSRKYLLNKKIAKRNVTLIMTVKMQIEINNVMTRTIVKNLKNCNFMDLVQKWQDLIPKKGKNLTKLEV